MKIGFRKPSLMKSIKAATTASFNRAIKKTIIPGYGEKGMGRANPKKAAYNALYNMTTVNAIDAIGKSRYPSNSASKERIIIPEEDISIAYRKIGTHPQYKTQCKKIKTLLFECRKIQLDEKIIQAADRILKFEQIYYKRPNNDQDLYSFIMERITLMQSESSKHRIQIESMIATNIMKMLLNGLSTDAIIGNLQQHYYSEAALIKEKI